MAQQRNLLKQSMKISYILQNCNYLKDFVIDEKNPLGKGSFGVVFKVKRKSDDAEFIYLN